MREAGLTTYAIDASPAMVAAFRERFPGVPIEQNSVEASELFSRTFDGVLAWGLLFLLEPKLGPSPRRWPIGRAAEMKDLLSKAGEQILRDA